MLLKRPPAEKYQMLTVFSAEHGLLTVLQRLAAKPNPDAPQLDLFDDAALTLASSNQGQTWFVNEARIHLHREGISRSYETLVRATSVGSLIVRNPVSNESRPAIAQRLRQSFDALAAATRDEATRLLYTPLAELTADQPVRTATAPLLRRLEDYLRGYTELFLD